MFENNHPVHFLRHYLNTSVFGSPTQTQFSTLLSGSFPNLYSQTEIAVFCTAVVSVCRVKIDREQIHYYLGG